MSQLGNSITLAVIDKTFTKQEKNPFPQEVCTSPLAKKQPESFESGQVLFVVCCSQTDALFLTQDRHQLEEQVIPME